MVRHPVRKGAVGVGRNMKKDVLLQVDDYDDPGVQARAVLTVPQAEDVILQLREQIEDIWKYPDALAKYGAKKPKKARPSGK